MGAAAPEIRVRENTFANTWTFVPHPAKHRLRNAKYTLI